MIDVDVRTRQVAVDDGHLRVRVQTVEAAGGRGGRERDGRMLWCCKYGQ